VGSQIPLDYLASKLFGPGASIALDICQSPRPHESPHWTRCVSIEIRVRYSRGYIGSAAYSDLFLLSITILSSHCNLSHIRSLSSTPFTLAKRININMIGFKSVAALAAVVSVVYAAAVPSPEDEWHLTLLKRQEPGTPLYACHESCGKHSSH